MKTTRILMKNLLGIRELELDGRSVELTGTNGTGKSSTLDNIRYALENSSEREYIIRTGAAEGEIIIETDTGLIIHRKKRLGKSDYKSVKENGREVQAPESFLSQIFTPLQLNPVAFTQMTRQEQNRAILDLIDFPWNLEWIRDQFGEIPGWVNYEQNILQVLNDIQSDNGDYFQQRQDVNRDIRNKRAFIEDIAKDIPVGYQAERWEAYDLGATYRELERIRENNSIIQRAKDYRDSYDNKLRGLQAQRDIALSAAQKEIASERESLGTLITRLKAEIAAAEDKIAGLDSKLRDKTEIAEAQYKEGLAKLERDMGTASKHAGEEPQDTSALDAEVSEAEAMKRYLNEYRRMKAMQAELDDLTAVSEEYTRKIELARELPGEILKTASIPVEGMTVENGVPLINGLPVSNLSEGEKLELCVDVTLSKPSAMQIILIDGAEKLSDENRTRLYAKCKERGLQFIATRTTNNNELEVTVL